MLFIMLIKVARALVSPFNMPHHLKSPNLVLKFGFFKHGLHALDYHLATLCNHVVCTGFPQAWSHHTIYLIHKWGPGADPNNYRTIMMSHIFSSIYATVLHMKLSRELERKLLRARGQAGFLPTHQTKLHPYTLGHY